MIDLSDLYVIGCYVGFNTNSSLTFFFTHRLAATITAHPLLGRGSNFPSTPSLGDVGPWAMPRWSLVSWKLEAASALPSMGHRGVDGVDKVDICQRMIKDVKIDENCKKAQERVELS